MERPLHPDRVLLRANITKIPIMPIEQLRYKLLNNFARYGIVKELVIYLDDWAQRWFSGNGCICLKRPPSSGIKFDSLTYKIPLDGNHSCLDTWSKMDKHCIYCKAMGHIMKDYPSLSTETRTCFVCHSRDHIARNCPKVTNPNQTASKRRRPIPLDSSYEATVTVLSRPVETILSTAPPTSSVPVLHEIPATSEEMTSAPALNHQPAIPMPSADLSVLLPCRRMLLLSQS